MSHGILVCLSLGLCLEWLNSAYLDTSGQEVVLGALAPLLGPPRIQASGRGAASGLGGVFGLLGIRISKSWRDQPPGDAVGVGGRARESKVEIPREQTGFSASTS